MKAAAVNKWYVLYVRSRSEKKVRDRLEQKNVEVFLPLMKVVRQWSDRKKTLQVPLFSGYIFVNLTEGEYDPVKMIEGIVGFVKIAGKNATIQDEKIEAIKKFIETGLPVETSSADFREGEKVRISFGPMKGFEGELISVRNEKHFIIRLDVINQVLKISVPSGYLEKI